MALSAFSADVLEPPEAFAIAATRSALVMSLYYARDAGRKSSAGTMLHRVRAAPAA